MEDELLDIVDDNDQVIGQQLRSEIYRNKQRNFRAINAFLMNSKGQLWIPRRTAHKRLFPLALDASVAGHVGAGETYLEAFKRELMEELRIDLDTVSYQHLGPLNPPKHDTSAFMQVYLIRTDTVPDYNPDDFIEYYWLTPQELVTRIEHGEPSKSDLPKIMQHMFLKKRN